jgi:hypothetical protein
VIPLAPHTCPAKFKRRRSPFFPPASYTRPPRDVAEPEDARAPPRAVRRAEPAGVDLRVARTRRARAHRIVNYIQVVVSYKTYHDAAADALVPFLFCARFRHAAHVLPV